jgi:hypothetical protein
MGLQSVSKACLLSIISLELVNMYGVEAVSLRAHCEASELEEMPEDKMNVQI